MRRPKPKADTADAAIRAMVNAGRRPHKPPAHIQLRPEDGPFWDGIVCARARDEWTQVDLVVAAQLARCQYDIEQESLTLAIEGTVLKNDRGTQVCNPRVSVLEQLARREMALMRSLRMGGRIAGDARDELGQRKIERQSKAVRKDLEDDELLAV